MSDTLFIEDGQNLTKSIPARPGYHAAVEAVYRPALAKERHAYAAKAKAGDPVAIDAFETDLIVRHVVTLNGDVAVKD